MKLKVIVVEPKYQINLGYMARVAKNFGINRLNLVNPRVNYKGQKAIMFSKHAKDLLLNARVSKSFGEAVKDCDIVVGTSGVVDKARSNFTKVLSLHGSMKHIKGVEKRKRRQAVIGLVIGRDDIGLTKDEIAECDIMTHIKTNEDYPVLNISHALAILLYAFSESGSEPLDKKDKAHKSARKETDYLFRTFDASLKGKKIRNRKAVSRIFRRIVLNAQPSDQEVHALISAIK